MKSLRAMSLLDGFFNSENFMPHGHCYLWRPDILWLNAGSDILIALAYFIIPTILIYFVKRRKDLQFNWIFVMFALFILACGTSHIVEVWTIWRPNYAIQGLVKLFTAGISLATAFALVHLVPRALVFADPDKLEQSQRELQRLNAELLDVNASLESRVIERTRETARLAAIVESSSDAILAMDTKGLITSWNPAAEKLFQYTALEMQGKSVYGLIPEAHREDTGRLIQQANLDGKAASIETVRLARDGRIVNVSTTISPIKDNHNTVIGFAEIARDITERVRTVQIMKRNEERFRRVIEAAPNGLLMVDQSGRIILCNTEFETLFGYKRDEIVGREMEFLVPERYRHNHPGHRRGFFQSPTTRQMGAGRDLYGLRKDGAEFPVEIGLNPLVTDEGTFVLASIVDITKRKVLEDRIRDSAGRLQQKNQEMEQFVYTVSHDLKSPLVTSSGFLGLLKEDLAAKRYDHLEDSMRRLERANDRMNQLISDLLQLSRVGRIKLEIASVDVGLLLKSVVESLSQQIQEKSVELTIEENLPLVRGDYSRIYQVFENVIINALKYGATNTPAKIEIGVLRSASDTDLEAASEIRYFVRDNGVGIAKDYHKKIFGLFQRLQNDGRGTGVGLAIVSRVMQLHGGRVWVESEPGQGATFWLAFPKVFVSEQENEGE